MIKVFDSVKENEKVLQEKYSLSENLMIENAAAALEKAIDEYVTDNQIDFINTEKNCVLIVTGCGNNGADGFVLARKIFEKYNVVVFQAAPPKSPDCVAAAKTAETLGVELLSHGKKELKHSAAYKLRCLQSVVRKAFVIVDCIYGTGFHGSVEGEAKAVIEVLNASGAYKIACDVPSGLYFKADKTVTMGAYKSVLLQDKAKDCVGEIVVANIGVSKKIFESCIGDGGGSGTLVRGVSDKGSHSIRYNNSGTRNTSFSNEIYLLEKSDMRLPVRKNQFVNKGSFGHTVIAMGNKRGAAIIASKASFAFGSGLVSILQTQKNEQDGYFEMPPEIMFTETIPEKATAVVVGPGLGLNETSGSNDEVIISLEKILKFAKDKNCALVFDADFFNYVKLESVLKSLSKNKVVLTPHPKEFQKILHSTGFGDFSVDEIIDNRVELAKNFCKKFANIVLVLKGANTIICCNEKVYVSTEGRSCLSKGGSGDVLSGLIGSLLAQGYSALDAALSGVLAQGIASQQIESSFSMSPFDLIDKIKKIENS